MDGVDDRAARARRAEFQRAGPAIVTRRKVVERLRLARNVPLEEYQFASALTDQAGEGDGAEPGPHLAALRLAELDGGLPRHGCVPGRRGRDHAPDHPRAGRRRLPLHPGRRARLHRLCRPGLARPHALARRGSQAQSRALDRGRQRRDRRLRRRHLRHPLCKRQCPDHRPRDRQGHAAVASRRPLRRHRRAAVLAAQAPPLPAGIRRRALRRLRAAQASCRRATVAVLGLVTTKRPDLEPFDLLQAAHRRGEPPSAARAAGAQPAMRLRRP